MMLQEAIHPRSPAVTRFSIIGPHTLLKSPALSASLSCQKLTKFASSVILGIVRIPRFLSMPMNISLTPHLEEMIREKIASGSYNSASEVVREALRLMEQEDQLRSLKLQRLRQDVQEGLDSGPSIVFDPQRLKSMAREKKSRTRAR
jgi:antitoxin ParD1/3/4